MDCNDLRPGRYRHFKGNEYRLECVARHSEIQVSLMLFNTSIRNSGVTL